MLNNLICFHNAPGKCLNIRVIDSNKQFSNVYVASKFKAHMSIICGTQMFYRVTG